MKHLSAEKYPYRVMLFFFPLRDEKQLLSGCPKSHQNKLHRQGVQHVPTSFF